jgi:protoporphyrin/coproporphyrin ferrochelatase
MPASPYDAILLVSFGGPEGPDEVIPFLENVLRGKNVPRERLIEVAKHYDHFGGISPINAQNRELIAALELELRLRGPHLPIYWGNRNWRPLLPDALRQMRDDSVRCALAFFTSAFSSYSGCRQYRENIAAAQREVGAGAPEVHKLRAYFNHPGFIEPMIERARDALSEFPIARRDDVQVVFTAHSIPVAMAQNCRYEAQLLDASQLIAEALVLRRNRWRLVYQSRSGPPHQPWLEPDILDYLHDLHAADMRNVCIVPVGFISDHMEVIYDLDTEARRLCDELGIQMVRAKTVGTHARFVRMIRELIVERIERHRDRPALGALDPGHDECPADCCLSGRPQ